MKSCLALLLFLASCAFAQEAPVPKIEFQSVPDFFKLPQEMNFGEVAGVAVDSHKHIFVFSAETPPGRRMERRRRNCSSSAAVAISFTRSATISTAGLTRTP